MSSNIKMVHNRDFDNATVTTTANELLPVTNLQLYDNGEAFRTDTINEIVIRIKHDSPVFVSCLIAWRANFSTTDTIQWRCYDTPDWSGAAVIDSGEQSAIEIKALGDFEWGIEQFGSSMYDDWGHNEKSFEYWAEETAVLTQEIIIKAPNNTDGFIDITRLYNGVVFTPEYNHSYGAVMKLIPVEDDGITTDDGSYHTIESPIYREIDFSLDWLVATERPVFFEFLRSVGKHHDFYLSMYPNEEGQKRRDHAFAAKFSSDLSMPHNFHNNHSVTLTAREA